MPEYSINYLHLIEYFWVLGFPLGKYSHELDRIPVHGAVLQACVLPTAYPFQSNVRQLLSDRFSDLICAAGHLGLEQQKLSFQLPLYLKTNDYLQVIDYETLGRQVSIGLLTRTFVSEKKSDTVGTSLNIYTSK